MPLTVNRERGPKEEGTVVAELISSAAHEVKKESPKCGGMLLKVQSEQLLGTVPPPLPEDLSCGLVTLFI